MSKTRDTGYLANVIQVHDTGVRIMSGSTMLMAISSSGAVTITGEMSGSDAANALLLDGTGSLAFTTTASYNAFSASYAIASGSFSSRTTQVEQTYANTGSNTFTGAQYVSDTSNGIGFTSTASFYTDGGLRVGKNAYVSGTAYFNNIVVFGTSSIQYITSSQVNIGANIITVNTDTPAVRFGGLSVFDSGSTQLTGSIFWDSEKNHWVYSNPSGSTYSGGMFISGPRSSALGNEQGTTACMLLVGQGSDHLTSSLIYHDSTITCVPNILNVGGALTGTSATFSSNVTGSTTIAARTGWTSAGNNASPFFDEAIILGQSGNHSKIQYGNSFAQSAGTWMKFVVNSNTANNTPVDVMTLRYDGNVGIKCTSPGYTLDVNGSVNINAQATTNQGTVQSLRISSNIGDSAVTINACSLLNYTYLAFAQNCVGKFEIGFSSCTDTTSPSTFYLNPNVQKGACGSAVFIKSNGNVGIGTASPVAADGSSKTLQLLNTVILQNVVGTQALFSNNAYYDGTWKRTICLGAAAVRMNTDSGQNGISFHVGPTGTAGSTITNWDTTDIKMRINLDGCIGIGRTCAEFTLDVNGDIALNRQNRLHFAASNAGDRCRSFLAGDYNNNIFVCGPSGNCIAAFMYTSTVCTYGLLSAAGGVKFANGTTTLNYYEQGTWTPRLKNGSFTTNAGTSNVGWYTRIGNLVTVGGTLDWGAGSGAQDGNSLQIACLPFASSNTSNERNVGQPGAPAASSIGFKCTGKGQLVLVNDPGNSFIYLIETFQDGTYTSYIHNPSVANAGTLYGFQMTYHTL